MNAWTSSMPKPAAGCSQFRTLRLGSLFLPISGVAVGHATGEREVYVGAYEDRTSHAHGVVGVFGPTDNLQATWTGANTPNGSFADSGGGSGANVTDVAVDEASGDLFVSTAQGGSSGVVDVFDPIPGGAEPAGVLAQLTGTCENVGEIAAGLAPCSSSVSGKPIPFEGGVRSIAVDPGTGELLVASGRAVDVFEPTSLNEYKFVRQITGASVEHPFGRGLEAVAAGGGEGDGDIYVVEEHEIEEPSVVYQFNFEGVYLGSLEGTPAGSFVHVRSVAVDPTGHDVFVGDEAGVVDVFGPDLIVPNVTTEAASDETATTAVLNGTVEPLKAQTGEGAECEFEYGLTTAYGKRVKCAQSVSGAEPVKSLTVEGLLSGTTYHYRLVAKNNNGSNAGADETFQTLGPGIVAESASEVTATSAVLGASVNPDGVETSYRFEYDTTPYREGGAPHGARLAEGVIPAGGEPVPVSAAVTGLRAQTLYHYRVVVSSDVEVTLGHTELHEFDGPDQTFTTQGFGSYLLPDHRRWEMVSPAGQARRAAGADRPSTRRR